MNNRKQQVTAVAQRLFIEKGFSSTSIQDIIQESGISKGTFYNYFSSKKECLIEILEEAQHRTAIRRNELLIGKAPACKEIFIEQVSIRILLNRELNLFPLFQDIFHSKDPYLKDFVIKHHREEILWMKQRLIEIYGADSKPYAADCAVLMLGMIQHMNQVYAMEFNRQMDVLPLIQFIMRRVDTIMLGMIKTKDVMIGEKLTVQAKIHPNKLSIRKSLDGQLQQLSDRLQDKGWQDALQFIEFLMEEIQLTNPRISLIKTISQSLKATMKDSDHESATRSVLVDVWRYIDLLESELNAQ